MKSNQIVAENLKYLLKLTGLKQAGLCALAENNGITLTSSTMSRMLNAINTKIDTFDLLVDSIRLLKGFEWVDQAALLTPGVFEPKDSEQVISTDTLKEHYFKLLIELNDIGWVKVSDKPGMDSIVDFCIHTFRKTGFKVEDNVFKSSALRSGS